MEQNTLFYLALILFSGLILGRAVKLIRLPNVTGYLIAGLIIGPYGFRLISANMVGDLELISEMALAFIAFTIGSEFKLSYIKRVGMMPIVIAIFEGLTASVLVTLALVLAGVDIEIALLLGAIASATAPAATVMVIKQYRTKGPVTETLLSVVALDDAVALILFGFASAIVTAMSSPGTASLTMTIVYSILEIVGSCAVGFLLGFLFTLPLRYFKKSSNRLIILTGFIFLGAALANMMGLSPLLLCMCIGAMLVNGSPDAMEVFKLTDSVTPPIFLMFFVVSGMNLNLTILPQIGLIGMIYIVVRVIGKISGAYIGSRLMKAPSVVRKYLGLSLIPQAGVAIGLALITARILPQYAETIQAVILGATFIYELIGPVTTKVSLQKAGEIPDQERA
ncbi:MAG: cation:proton antiporter [Clostridiales bacterium]|nr:cation:proton antiporter [Clostridiales bacterium]